MSYFRWKDTEMYYETYEGKKPVLLIHGWGIDHTYLMGCMEPVFENYKGEYGRTYIDLPGMGKSIPGNVRDGNDIIELLLAFVQEVMHGQPVMLAGNSFGGLLCSGFAAKAPELVTEMILITPSTRPNQTLPKQRIWKMDDAFFQSLSTQDQQSFSFYNTNLIPEVWERYQNYVYPAAVQNKDNDFLNHILQGRIACDLYHDEKVTAFQKPVLIVAGKQDNCVGYEDQFELAKRYPESTYILLNGAGHNLVFDQPEAFSHCVEDFLSQSL